MVNVLEIIFEAADGLTPTLETASGAATSLESNIESASQTIDSVNGENLNQIASTADNAGNEVRDIANAADEVSQKVDIAATSSDKLNAFQDLAIADQLKQGAVAATEFADNASNLNTQIGQAAIRTGETANEVRNYAVTVSDANLTTSEAVGWIQRLGIANITSADQVTTVTDNMKVLKDSLGLTGSETEKLVVGLKKVGVPLDELPSSFNALGYMMQNTNVSAGDLTTFLSRNAKALQDNKISVDQLALIYPALIAKYGDARKANSGFNEIMKESAGDLSKIEAALGLEAGALSNASAKTAESAGALEKMADVKKENVTLGQQLVAIYDDITTNLAGIIAPAASVAGGLGQIGFAVFGLQGVYSAVMSVNTALTASNITMASSRAALIAFATNPVTLALIALAALAAIIIYAGTQYGWFSSAIENANNALNEGKQAVDAAKQSQADAQAEVDKWTQAVNNAKPGTDEYTNATKNLETAKNNLTTATNNLSSAESGYNDASATHKQVMADYAAAVENARKQTIAYKVAIGELTPEQGEAISKDAEWAAQLTESDRQTKATTGSINNNFIPTWKKLTEAASKNPFHEILGDLADINFGVSTATNAWETFEAILKSPSIGDPTLTIREALRGVFCWIVGCSPGVIPAFQLLVLTILGLPGQIAGGLGAILGAVITWAMGLISNAQTAGSGFYNTILFYMLSLPGMVWAYLLSALSYIASFAGSAYSYASTAGRNIYSGVASGISGIAGMVWGELNRIGSTIMSAGGSLYSQAVSLGQTIYNGLKAGLGIASPGYMYWAVHNELGLIDDVINNNDIPSSSENLGKDIADSFSPGSSKGKSSSKSSDSDSSIGKLEITLIHDFKNTPSGISKEELLAALKGLSTDLGWINTLIKTLNKAKLITKADLGA